MPTPRLPFLLAGLTLVAVSPGVAPLAADGAPPEHRGVSWVAGREISAADLQPLVDAHVNWIVQTPFGWQRAWDSPEIALVTDGRIYWGERDEGLEATTRLALDRGIRTLLKPHLWLRRGVDGKWRSDIAMRSPEAWRAWWEDYRAFILHYARLGERIGVSALAVGTELRSTVLHDPDAWRRLIADVREVFSGQLTYSANWYLEYEEVPFWDALDFIGIQAYFPLADGDRPSLQTMRRAWEPHAAAIEQVQRRWGKPVLFTEIGYRSAPDAAAEPWRWPQRAGGEVEEGDLRLQADAYRAFFETFWEKPWFAGAYIWKWYPGWGGGPNADFTPQGKPAEAVLREWYGRAARRG